MSKVTGIKSQGYAKAPKDLNQAGKELWSATLAEWDMSDSDMALLHVACQQQDRIVECQIIIERDGVLLTDPSGRQRAHPLLSIEKEACNTLMRAWRMLNLTDSEAPKIGRPQMAR